MSSRPTPMEALAGNPATSGLVLDFDGVLSPIINDPAASRLPRRGRGVPRAASQDAGTAGRHLGTASRIPRGPRTYPRCLPARVLRHGADPGRGTPSRSRCEEVAWTRPRGESRFARPPGHVAGCRGRGKACVSHGALATGSRPSGCSARRTPGHSADSRRNRPAAGIGQASRGTAPPGRCGQGFGSRYAPRLQRPDDGRLRRRRCRRYSCPARCPRSGRLCPGGRLRRRDRPATAQAGRPDLCGPWPICGLAGGLGQGDRRLTVVRSGLGFAGGPDLGLACYRSVGGCWRLSRVYRSVPVP